MLSFEQDQYIIDRYEDKVRWIVTLSDGRKVYQDDDRPGLSEPVAWKRLRTFLQENENLSIVGMTIGFRDHIINIGDNADGYYFCNAILGEITTGLNLGFYICGTLKDGILMTTMWKIPEIIPFETENRDPLKAGECLICQKNVLENLSINQLPQTFTAQPPNTLQNLFA